MCENARFENRQARVENARFKNSSVSNKCRRLLEALVDSVSVRFKNARMSKNALKHSYAVECRNRLRVGVRAKNASVTGFACRRF